MDTTPMEPFNAVGEDNDQLQTDAILHGLELTSKMLTLLLLDLRAWAQPLLQEVTRNALGPTPAARMMPR